jgi:hypothetical protein
VLTGAGAKADADAARARVAIAVFMVDEFRTEKLAWRQKEGWLSRGCWI